MTTSITATLCGVLQTLFQTNAKKCWAVCCSGGVDSRSVLAAANFSNSPSLTQSVCYVNHLAPSHPFNGCRFSHSLALNTGMIFCTARIFLSTGDYGVEGEFRTLRHKLFHLARPRTLLLGHNLNDQIETLVMQFKRGSHLAGLSGMPRIGGESSGDLKLRLFLGLCRSSIRSFAILNKLIWSEDLTNSKNYFVRSLVRRMLGPNPISGSCCKRLWDLIMVLGRTNIGFLTAAHPFCNQHSSSQHQPWAATKIGSSIQNHILMKSNSYTSIIMSKQMEAWRQMMLYRPKGRNYKTTWFCIGEDKILRH